MTEQTPRTPDVASLVAKINLGQWGRADELPWWQALGVRPQPQLAASLVGAVHLLAQVKAADDRAQQEALGKLMSEVIDDLCDAHPARRLPPRSRWTQLLEELRVLAEGYPPGSLLRDATLDLGQRVQVRMHEAEAVR